MNYDMAPMEGLTTYIYRSTYEKYYGGIDQYYTPFLASMHLSNKEKNEVLPEHNKGMKLIPQILSNHADEFIEITKALKDYGYTRVNLNLGCPSGTVVSKHRGAGFLDVPDELDRFLQEIYEKCELEISIKTRLGISEEYEWEDILKVYEKYPIAELIVHTRLQRDFYRHPTRPQMYAAAKRLGVPLCYNGDITDRESQQTILAVDPAIDRIMLGRGLIADPELPERLRGHAPRDMGRLRDFMEELCERYRSEMGGGDRNTLYKMKEIWVYMGENFVDGRKYVKAIKKANRIFEYESAMNALFGSCEWRQ